MSNTTTPNNTTNLWQPAVGSTWNYLLVEPLNLTTLQSLPQPPTFSIWDIDLFDNSASTISTLQSPAHNSTKIICYFSAGTYENWRPDANQFPSSDLGDSLSGWAGERWINISRPAIREIMVKRLDMAVSKGCNGVDPDNVDGYSNQNGLGLTQSDSINYLHFLANETSARNLSIGLKNANTIVADVVDLMQWSVNEQCHQYEECSDFDAFIEQGKPVFNVEYPKGDTVDDNNPVTSEQLQMACNDTAAAGAKGFSTIVKNMNLNYFTETCDGLVVSVAGDASSGGNNGGQSGAAAKVGVSMKGICTAAVVFSMLFVNLIA